MKRLCLFRQTFFGLTAEHKQYFFEEIFQLTFYGKISLSEAQKIPIYYRKWLIQRTIKEYKAIAEKQEKELAKAKGKR